MSVGHTDFAVAGDSLPLAALVVDNVPAFAALLLSPCMTSHPCSKLHFHLRLVAEVD